MARSLRARIETRSARLRLPGRKDPYYQQLERGLSAGYHRPLGGGDGTWWGRVRVGNGYRVKVLPGFADDHPDADGERILNWAQAQAAIRAWAAKQTEAGPYTVADAQRDYVTDLRARRGDAAADDANARLNKHLSAELSKRLLADLTEADVRSFRNDMVKKSDDEERVRRFRDTANRVLGIFKAMANLAFNAGKVTDDRAWRKVGPFEDAGASRKVFLSDQQQQKLLNVMNPDLRDLVATAAETGARCKELTDARVRDLDLERATLAVKSNKGHRGKIRRRDIYLPAATLARLRRLTSGKQPDDHLFLTSAGTPWMKSQHKRPFEAAVKKTGLDQGTCFYSLRHSYISRALKMGVPTQAVAAQCGTSAAMIERHYAKFIRSDLARYAQEAAPVLKIDPDDKVVQLKQTA
jgi:integrase